MIHAQLRLTSGYYLTVPLKASEVDVPDLLKVSSSCWFIDYKAANRIYI